MTKFYLSFSRYVMVFAFMLLATVAWSQRTVTGKVTSSDDGSDLPGVNIVEKGTNNGTISGADGSYSLSVNEGAVLVFSFVGYKATEVAVGAQTTVDVTLEADITSLSEVVVIGYGEVNKRDATGAVVSVKSEDFNKGVISSPEQLIQGKSAGVQITTSSGEPGSGVNIRIRGTSSVRGGNNPLVVVDGIPLSGGEVSAGGSDFGRGGSTAKNPLNFINPNDIESMDVLKDASATAIYGSRGANGVIIITTKSGKGAKKKLEYSTNLSFSNQARKHDVLNAKDYLEAYDNLGGDAVTFNYGADTNWQDEINRTAFSKNHNLAFSNNYKGGNYRISLSYDDQEGIIKETGMKRLTGRLNLNQNFFEEKLKFGAQLLFSKVNDEAAPITNSAGFEGDLIASSIFFNPTAPANVKQYAGDAANPLSLLKYYLDQTETNRNLLNFSLGYEVIKGLNVKVNTGFDRSNSLREAGHSGFQEKIPTASGKGRAFYNDLNNDSDLLEAFITYDKSTGSSVLNLLAGYSFQEFRTEGMNASAAGFADWNLPTMFKDLHAADGIVRAKITSSNFQNYGYQEGDVLRYYEILPEIASYGLITNLPQIPTRTVIGGNWKYYDQLQSFFARANYSMNDRFFFTASIRADGSTKFGKNKKYGTFPAAAVKWRMSEEGFVPELFDDLALRVGFGVTGNQEIPHNVYSTRVRWKSEGIGNDGLLSGGTSQTYTPGTENVSNANPDLQWEQTSQINIGIDYGILGSRIYGSLEFYSKNTTKLLYLTAYPAPAATPFRWENLDANVINNGMELTLNAVAIDKDKLDVNLGFNIAYNKNLVKNFDGTPANTGVINGQGLTDAYAQRIDDNQPLFSYYLRDWKGFKEDGTNDDDDIQRFVGKSALPKVNLGFSLSVKYMNFDLAAYLTGQFGHYVYNNVANAMFTKGSIAGGRNVIKSVLSTNESPSNSPDVSTRFLEKGNFLRMQTLSLGYSFDLKGESVFKSLRLSATGQNLFLITNYSGLDPEVNVDKAINGVPSLGIDYTAYPRARTVSFGLNATF